MGTHHGRVWRITEGIDPMGSAASLQLSFNMGVRQLLFNLSYFMDLQKCHFHANLKGEKAFHMVIHLDGGFCHLVESAQAI